MKSLTVTAGGWVVAALGLALGACGAPEPGPGPQAGAPAEIAWFPGDVDAAFAESLARGRPVLLFWGAEWCPDCQQLKSSVFTRPDFIAKSQLFVPVHLDGDQPGAQRWADVFGVAGYPTVVILDGSRREITRLAGGMDLNRYAELLDNALGDVRPVSEILRLAREGKQLSADDCRRLAYYAFSLDDAEAADPVALAAVLDGVGPRCPAQAPRLQLLAATLAVRAPATAPEFPAALRSLDGILATGSAGRDDFDLLLGLDAGLLPAARAAAPSLATDLARRLGTLAGDAAADSRFAAADQLLAERLRLRAAAALSADGAMDPQLAAAAVARAEDMLATRRSAFEHTSVVNAAANLYRELGETARARDLLAREAAASKTPWYFLGKLAALEEAAGNNERALALLAEAHERATGGASRFQWGYDHLSGLLRLAPDDLAAIRTVGRSVIGELSGRGDMHGRTRQRLARLGEELRAWSDGRPDRAGVAAELDVALAAACGPADPAVTVSDGSCPRLASR